MKKYLFPLTKRSMALICVGFVLNLMGRGITTHYGAPFFLDTIGTFLVAILLGPLAGAVTGILLNIGSTMFFSAHWLYLFTSIGGALIVGHFLHGQDHVDSFKIVGTSVLTGLVTATISTPIDLFIFSGYTNNVWGDALVELLSEYFSVRPISTFLSELFLNIPDKAISIILLMVVILLAKKAGITLDLQQNKPEETSEMTAHLLVGFLLASTLLGGLMIPTMETKAAGTWDFAADYTSLLYGLDEGLNSTVMNAVTQTGDGYVWLGSYAGVFRYDGTRFEQMNLDDRITNSMALFTDHKGRLWIGTNDSGVACYDPYTEELEFFTTKDGLSSDYIRSICEDAAGNIYVGTSSYLCRITLASQQELAAMEADEKHRIVASEIKAYDEFFDVTFVQALCAGENNEICGVTQSGIFFLMEDDQLRLTTICDWESNSYSAVDYMGNHRYVVGSTGEHVDVLSVDDKQVEKIGTFETGGLQSFNCITYCDNYNGCFVACDNGFGFIDSAGGVQNLTREGFDTGISDAMVDRQGNLWVTSSKNGVLKVSKNPFSDLFQKIGQTESPVNGLCLQGDDLYIAMDNGVIHMSLSSKELVEDPRLQIFENVRVRQISVDSAGNLWFSTYGEMGLVRIDPEGVVTNYTSDNSEILGSRFRFTQQLRDGRVLAASSDGLSFFKNNELVKTIGVRDGLTLPKALSITEDEDGTLWLGTDGDGVYEIQKDQVVDHITQEDGLSSLIVMKIVPCDGGRLYVCSNGLYYHKNDGQVTRLKNFPYSNNYNVYINAQGQAFVSSSAGLYVLSEADMLADQPGYSYTLLNGKCGLTASLTANEWDLVVDDKLYLCCTEGVRVLDMKRYADFDPHYQIAIRSITKDGTPVPQVNGIYSIPSGSGQLMISPVVLNYTLSDPLVYVELEGVDAKGSIMRQSDMRELYYSKLSNGNYRLLVQVLDETGTTVQKEKVFLIHKEAKMYEKGYFKIYVLFVVFLVLTFIIWLLAKLGNLAVIHRQYEEIREAKEDAEYANQTKSSFFAQMSHELRTPIHAVLGMDEMILRESSEGHIRNYAMDIYNAGNLLLSLVNDIMDSSKLESGKMELVPEEYELATLVRNVVQIVHQHAQTKDLKLEIEVDETLPRRLEGDDIRIRQIISNLLMNAVKYTMMGSVTLRMRGERQGDDELLHVEIEDTGIGIKEEDIPKIFEQYRRVDTRKNHSVEGTGLGMTITIQLLELMGSRLDVESIYGKGTKFFFDLRQKVVDGSPVGNFEKRSATVDPFAVSQQAFTAEDAKILVVDDNAMNRKVFRSLLRRTQVCVSEAASGAEALALVEWGHYDMVFMDYLMPEMNGLETMERMRKIENCKDVPVYVLTANVTAAAKEEYLYMGFDGFLPKPMTLEMVEEALQEALPSEKIHPLSEEQREQLGVVQGKQLPPLPEELPEVVGVDWEYAWMHLSDLDLLRNGVKTFYDLIESQATQLQECYEAMLPKVGNKSAVVVGSEDADNPLVHYTKQVHYMVEAARTVGIVSLAGSGDLLEQAAGQGNLKLVHVLHEPFLQEWKSYTEKLQGVFGLGYEAENGGD